MSFHGGDVISGQMLLLLHIYILDSNSINAPLSHKALIKLPFIAHISFTHLISNFSKIYTFVASHQKLGP
jgi:hypothetical protein